MKKNLYLMYAIALLQGMVFYGPIATLYRQAQGISIFQITVIESISLALGILLEIPWGILADKIGYRKTMIICSGIYFLSKLVFWKATHFTAFLVERMLLSVVVAGFSGVDTSIIYLSSDKKESQKAFGLYNSMGMIGLLVAAGIFSFFVKDNYSLAAFLTVVAYGVAALLSFGITDVASPKKEKHLSLQIFKTILRDTVGNRSFVVFLMAVALLTETHQTITVFLSQLQYDRCGMSSSTIGFLYILITVLGLFGAYSVSVTKRIGVKGALLLFGGMFALSCSMLALAPYAMPSVLSMGMLRITNTLFQPLQLEMQNRQIKTAHRATALSVCSMLISSIGIVTNLVFGALSAWNLSLAFLFGSGMCVVSLFLFLWWCNRHSIDE